ncbi:MAG: cbb3-type cytochrome c oxidase subunit I [Deltaproteobacteria bacterium]|nr:cbb3-type cytochrome c oxidase subunit I [Deltaproteobacteria bacterium]
MAAITSSPGHHDDHGDPNVSFLKAKSGLMSWLVTLDHKRIGIMYLISVTIAFALGGTFALLVRTELFTKGQTIMNADNYNRMFSLHGVVMVFLFIIPSIPAAMGNIMLPIQLGTKDVAFPRLNLLSFYIYVFGALFGVYSMVNGGVDTGWTFYTPYSSSDPAHGGVGSSSSVIPMTLAAFIMGFSSILTGVNFIATVHKMRAPGLTWRRLTLFTWALYATSIIQVLATPVLAITLLLLTMERFLGLGIFDPHLGGDPVLFQHFFWFYSHPAVYIMIVPGMGVVSEIIATFSRREPVGYMAIAASSLGLALLGFLVWGHHLFVAGMSEYATMVFSALTFLVAIPSGVKVFNWVATLYKGSISLQSPMLWGLSFVFLFTIGGLTGLFLGMLATDVHLHDTYFVVAHFHYVMVGGTVMGFVGGLHYWWPKFTGKLYDETWAKVGWFFVFIGFNTTFLIQFVMGSRGMPRRYYDYLPMYEQGHQISTIGSYILGFGFIILLIMFIRSLLNGKPSPRNPWGSAALEWMTPTPPPTFNFLEGKDPVLTRGQYDYHLATDDELYDGYDDPMFPASGDGGGKKAH